MKVLDLQCSQQHSFEGWFGSEDDFQSQLTRGLVQCPLCGNAEITKKLSAPRFNLGYAAATPATATSISEPKTEVSVLPKSSPRSSQAAGVMQAAWLEVAKHVMANTEDVGNSFASEARKIHYGEADERAIRGQATPDQTMELIEEGIDVMALPIPESLKRPLN
jgi:hypothetical protein